MVFPKVSEIVEAHNQRNLGGIGEAQSALFQRYGLEPLIPLLIEAFPNVRSGNGRHSILFALVRFARSHGNVVDLAITALQDRAFLVREEACSVLAYSLRTDAVPHLSQLQSHKDLRTRASAVAAIDAITHKNHHYYIDRKHTGTTFWGVRAGE